MSEAKKFVIECTPENARKFAEWIATRGGVASWQSVNLSNPGASWSTPAQNADGTPTTKPTWQAGAVPSAVVTDPADVGVFTDALYKAFPVGLRRGDGFSYKLTDAAQRKLDKHLDACREKHGDAFYRRGVINIDGASMGVYYTVGVVSLADWLAANPVQS